MAPGPHTMDLPQQLADETRRAQQAFQEDERLQDVCESNGLTKEDFVHGRLHVHSLEMFLTNLDSLRPFAFFPALRVLQVMHCEITEIVGLESCPGLEKLWLNENNLSRISGLERCTRLVELYLYSNQLQQIEGLATLTQLEVLWLMDNRLRRIEGLSSLTRLRSLNLAANRLERLGTALEANRALEELNVAANRLGCFRDIPLLDRLPRLTALCFADPHFGDNPICGLCNYQTYVLYHLPSLARLDTALVTDEQRRLADTTFVKKQMYYNMRIKTLRRNSNALLRRAAVFRDRQVAELTGALAPAVQALKRLDCAAERPKYLAEAGLGLGGAAGAGAPAADEGQRRALQRHVAERQAVAQEVHGAFQEMRDRVVTLTAHCVSRLQVELQTGGNIRLEEGRPGDVWFKSCADLFKSRFFPADYAPYGLGDVRVVRISRIHNRHLRNRFDARFADVTDTCDPMSKRALEYLFYGEDPELPGELLKALEDGYRRGSEMEAAGKDYGVPLTNSVFLCDEARLTHLAGRGLLGAPPPSPAGHALTGRVLVTKVFLGKCMPDAEAGRSSCTSPLVARKEDAAKVRRRDYPAATSSVYRVRAGDPRQRAWFVFDHTLALPEYFVEFAYVPATPWPRAAGLCQQQDAVALHEALPQLLPIQSPSDAADLALLAPDVLVFMQHCTALPPPPADPRELLPAPTQPAPPPLPDLDAAALPRVCSDHLPETTPCLCLVGLGIRRVESLARLTALRVLVLAFNELERTDALQGLPSLVRLDVSHNRLRRLEGLKGLPLLRRLDAGHNLLPRVEEVNVLRRGVPQLEDLTLAGNPLCEERDYRATAIRRLTALAVLDGIPVLPQDREHAEERLVVVSNSVLLERGWVPPLPWSTPLLPLDPPRGAATPGASVLPPGPCDDPGGRRAKELLHPLELGYRMDGPQFTPVLQQIVELDLSGLGLRKVQHLEALVSLRKLNLRGNDLARMEGLEHCTRLEELNLEGNRITHVEGVATLTLLRRLDLGGNRLATLAGVEALPQLHQLAVEDNCLASLAGVAALQNLLELYAGNNRLETLADLDHLRSLFRLIILDLSGNPACSDPEYRLHAVYYLKKLKVLDGRSVDPEETARARDVFVGRLTPEVLQERAGPPAAWGAMALLDLGGLGLKELALLDGFPALQHLRLETNLLANLSGLQPCHTLVSLNLSVNRLGLSPPGHVGQCLAHCPRLQSLELEGNGLTSVAALGLTNASLLRLNLRDNELTRLDGLQAVPALEELYLDRNTLRSLEAGPLSALRRLRVLHASDNMLRSLDGVRVLEALESLSVASNRIGELAEFDALERLPHLREVTANSNPVARRTGYRYGLAFKAPHLRVVDGREVTDEERERAQAYFALDPPAPSPALSSARSVSSHSSGVSGKSLPTRIATPLGDQLPKDAVGGGALRTRQATAGRPQRDDSAGPVPLAKRNSFTASSSRVKPLSSAASPRPSSVSSSSRVRRP